MSGLIKPSDSLLPKKGKLLPKGTYKTFVKSREAHEFKGPNPATGKVEDFTTWKYVLVHAGEVELIAFSHDTFGEGTPVAAWVEVRRQNDANHVPRSYNVVTKMRELRGTREDPKFIMH